MSVGEVPEVMSIPISQLRTGWLLMCPLSIVKSISVRKSIPTTACSLPDSLPDESVPRMRKAG